MYINLDKVVYNTQIMLSIKGISMMVSNSFIQLYYIIYVYVDSIQIVGTVLDYLFNILLGITRNSQFLKTNMKL